MNKEDLEFVQMFDIMKSKYLEHIYEKIHVMDSMWSHYVPLLCLSKAIDCFIEDFIQATDEETESDEDITIKKLKLDFT